MKILTGIKASGKPHLGNYLGALKPAISLIQDSKTSSQGYFFIADSHALTQLPDRADLSLWIEEVAKTWLSCGLDYKKHHFYLQSDVPEIFELAWILSCFTPKGFMNRSHAYKAVIAETQNDDKVNMGLFFYPVLMASDILLFQADKVPVGEDQLQHLEFTRDIAQKFNNKYGEILTIPKAHVVSEISISGVDGRKMSKSYNNYIPLFETPQKLRKTIMKIKTDSKGVDEAKTTDNCLLFELYQHFSTVEEQEELKKRYETGIGWGEVKERLFENISSHLKPYQSTYDHYTEKPEELQEILREGAVKVRQEAGKFLKEIKKAIGFSN